MQNLKVKGMLIFFPFVFFFLNKYIISDSLVLEPLKLLIKKKIV